MIKDRYRIAREEAGIAKIALPDDEELKKYATVAPSPLSKEAMERKAQLCAEIAAIKQRDKAGHFRMRYAAQLMSLSWERLEEMKAKL